MQPQFVEAPIEEQQQLREADLLAWRPLSFAKTQHDQQLEEFAKLAKRFEERPLRDEVRVKRARDQDEMARRVDPIDLSFEQQLARAIEIMPAVMSDAPSDDDSATALANHLRYLEQVTQIQSQEVSLIPSFAEHQAEIFRRWERYAERRLRMEKAQAKRREAWVTTGIYVVGGLVVAAGVLHLGPALISAVAVEGSTLYQLLTHALATQRITIFFRVFGVVKFSTEQIAQVIKGEKDPVRAAALIAKEIGTTTVSLTITGVLTPVISNFISPTIWGAVTGSLVGQMVNGMFHTAANWVIVPDTHKRIDMEAELLLRYAEIQNQVSTLSRQFASGMTLEEIEALNNPRVRLRRYFQEYKGVIFATVLGISTGWALMHYALPMLASAFPWMAAAFNAGRFVIMGGFALGRFAVRVVARVSELTLGLLLGKQIEFYSFLNNLFLQGILIPYLSPLLRNTRAIRWITQDFVQKTIDGLDFIIVPKSLRRKLEEKIGFNLVRNWFVQHSISMFMNLLVEAATAQAITVGYNGLGAAWEDFTLERLASLPGDVFDVISRMALGFNPITAGSDIVKLVDKGLEETFKTRKQFAGDAGMGWTDPSKGSQEPGQPLFEDNVSAFDKGRANMAVQRAASNIGAAEETLAKMKAQLEASEQSLDAQKLRAYQNGVTVDYGPIDREFAAAQSAVSGFESQLTAARAAHHRNLRGLYDDTQAGRPPISLPTLNDHTSRFQGEATLVAPEEVVNRALTGTLRMEVTTEMAIQRAQLEKDLVLEASELVTIDRTSLQSMSDEMLRERRDLLRHVNEVRERIDQSMNNVNREMAVLDQQLSDLKGFAAGDPDLAGKVASFEQKIGEFRKRLDPLQSRWADLIERRMKDIHRMIVHPTSSRDLNAWVRRLETFEHDLEKAASHLPNVLIIGIPDDIIHKIIQQQWIRQFPTWLKETEIKNPTKLMWYMAKHRRETAKLNDAKLRGGQLFTNRGAKLGRYMELLEQAHWIGNPVEPSDELAKIHQTLRDTNRNLDGWIQKMRDIQTPEQLESTVNEVSKGLDSTGKAMDRANLELGKFDDQLAALERRVQKDFEEAGYTDSPSVVIDRYNASMAEYLSSQLTHKQRLKLSQRLGYDVDAMLADHQMFESGKSRRYPRQKFSKFRDAVRDKLQEDAKKEMDSCFVNPRQVHCKRNAIGPHVIGTATGAAATGGAYFFGVPIVAAAGSITGALKVGSGVSGAVGGSLYWVTPQFNIADFYLETAINAVIEGADIIDNFHTMMGGGQDVWFHNKIIAAGKVGYKVIPWRTLMWGHGMLRNAIDAGAGYERSRPFFGAASI